MRISGRGGVFKRNREDVYGGLRLIGFLRKEGSSSVDRDVFFWVGWWWI